MTVFSAKTEISSFPAALPSDCMYGTVLYRTSSTSIHQRHHLYNERPYTEPTLIPNGGGDGILNTVNRMLTHIMNFGSIINLPVY